ncbi:Dabb family protein [Sulfitobacter sp. S190]|uniref:Dabb family protein n=1 Tax=Sulfitobacter sp. S190 TaxID=2867022 RepID=UPI0021A74F98|nr:Dabb family protein [Sulfitobacter sp. S190]UWR22936.1 Dabb family protein [Sulfitobacter sp. S190]
MTDISTADASPQRSFIRHVVFFSARDRADLETVHRGLSILQGIPGAQCFEVSYNRHVDRFSDAVDVVVYAEFEDQAALDRYQRHPLYEESIRIVRPLRDLRVAADF